MKSFLAICLFSLAAVAFARPKELAIYSEKADTDIEEIFNNRRLFLPYIKCALEQGKCSADGKDLKTHLRDLMETDCGDCTPKQKKSTKQVVKHLVRKESEYWKKISAKYDPNNKNAPKYEAEALQD